MQIFSDYQITERIYESSNSLVYRGRRQTNGQAVVLKLDFCSTLTKEYTKTEKHRLY